jgi:UDP-2,3-diacylglucosamine pyrophosphatase LpxH
VRCNKYPFAGKVFRRFTPLSLRRNKRFALDSYLAVIPALARFAGFGRNPPMANTAWFDSAYTAYMPLAATRQPSRPRRAASANKYHRTIFISDTHLGTRGCKAETLAAFLEQNDCGTLFLVGDIVDGWQLKRRWYWSEAQTKVVREILRKVDRGTRVIFVPGNHDEFARDYCGRVFAGIEVIHEIIYETADGKHLLVLHGDRFDGVIACAKWLAHLGDWAYTIALMWNDALGVIRRRIGLPYWSLSAWVKHKIKNAVEYISRFEEAVAREAASRGVDGVVCGHIHHAEIRHIGGVLYLNDGDWVESCTALVEDAHGNLEILRWATPSQANTIPDRCAAPRAKAAFIPA